MIKKKKLNLINNQKQEIKIIENFIREKASSDKPLNILEAGCGTSWPFNLDRIQYILTGVDMDKRALEIRKNTLDDLNETIEGDLCSIKLGKNTYDVIYCSFVLEHIKNADKVMRNFVKWLKPDGIIIIKIPDPYSVHGYITRITPHWFHVFYYRFILGKKDAGKPGHNPYPTHYHSIVSRKGIRKFCNDMNSSIELIAEYGDEYYRPGKGIVKVLLSVIKKVISIISLGKLSSKHTNLLYVLRK